MIKYEAYNATRGEQFVNESDAIAFANANNMQVRQVNEPIIVLPKNPNWTGFKNAVFLENFAFLDKCLDCRTYSLLSGIILSAETGAEVHEENFLKIFRLLQKDLQDNNTAMTTDEVTFINEKLVEFEFSFTI